MHAGACLFSEWFRHEGRFQTMCLRHGLHHPFVHDCIIARPQHVGLVTQGQFALPRRKFGYRGFQWKPLNIAGFIQLIKERPKVVQFTQAINLNHLWCFVAIIGPCGANGTVTGTLRVQQVKFKLHSQCRGQTHFCKTVNDQTQHMPRVQIMRLTVQLIKIDHELRGIVPRPWRPDERSRDWLH